MNNATPTHRVSPPNTPAAAASAVSGTGTTHAPELDVRLHGSSSAVVKKGGEPVRYHQVFDAVRIHHCPGDGMPALPALSPSAGESHKLKPLVLIADDDIAVRQILRIYMEMNGFSVREAGMGVQLLANLHCNPDLILLDLTMPGMSGEECLRQIKNRRPELKVIVVSGRIDVEESRLDSNAFEFIAKPVDSRKLLASVHRAIQSPRKEAALSA